MAEKIYLADTSEDDGVRAAEGVVATLVRAEQGKTKIIFDDVRSVPGEQRTMIRTGLYTWHILDDESLDAMALSDEELQDIGAAVVARLLAASGRLK